MNTSQKRRELNVKLWNLNCGEACERLARYSQTATMNRKIAARFAEHTARVAAAEEPLPIANYLSELLSIERLFAA